jgi:hypothetical protein
MDRLGRILSGASLAVALGLVISAAGCRSMRSEVPAGKPYSTNGGTPPTVGFSSDPRSNPAASAGQWGGGAPMTPGNSVPDGGTSLSGASSLPQSGTPMPNSTSSYGTPGSYRYGGAGPTTTNP